MSLASRSLNNLHQDVKKTCTRREFQRSHILKQQTFVLEKIINLQQKICLNCIQQCQYGANVDDSLAPFYFSTVSYELQTKFEKGGIDKQNLDQFFIQLSKNLNQFSSTVDFTKLANLDDEILIPYDFCPAHFILSSTLPSIFGYCWSSEFAESYIDFLFNTALVNPTFTSAHFTFSLSNFLRISIGSTFYKRSMGSEIYNLVTSFKTQDGDLLAIVSGIINNMHQNIQLIPRHVRRIIRRFLNIDENKLFTAESFVCECLIVPAIKQPKEYGVIDYSLTISPNIFTKLNNLCGKFLEASCGDPDSDLHKKFASFVSECADVDEIADLPLVSQILPLLGNQNLPLVLSVPDACCLAYLVRYSDCPNNLKSLAEKIATKSVSPFRFVSVILDDLSDNTNEEKETCSPITKLLFNFFRIAPIYENSPNELNSFTAFHQKKAEQEQDDDTQILLQRIICTYPEKCSKEFADILPDLEDELNRQKLFATKEEESLAKLSVLCSKIDSRAEFYDKQFEDPHNAFYSLIFEDFINSLDDFKDLERRSLEYIISVPKFISIFDTYYKILHSSKIMADDETFKKLVICLHTWFMMQIPLDAYVPFHPPYKSIDDLFMSPSEKMINELCIDPAGSKVKKLFQNVEIFQLAIDQMSEARKFSIPCIALEHLNNAMNILSMLFFMEYGSSAQADELTPIIHYLLLKCGVPNLFSFVMYLSDYFYLLTTKGILTIEESKIVGLTHIINHVTSIVEYITLHGYNH